MEAGFQLTDKEKAAAAWAELTQTTIDYPRWKRQGFTAGHWANAKALIDQIGATTAPPPAPDPAGTVLFSFDPASGTLKPWVNFDIAGATHQVSGSPAGYSGSNGVMEIYKHPVYGAVVRETVTPLSNGGAAAGTDSVMLWNPQDPSVYLPRQETWEHWECAFGGPNDPFPFRPNPSASSNPWMLEHHNDDTTFSAGQPPSSQVYGVFTDDFTGLGDPASKGERLVMRLHGGVGTSGDTGYRDWHTYTGGNGCAYVPIILPIVRDHLYDILTRTIWSPDPAVGLVQCWVDGVLKYDQRLSTLTQTSSGHVDHPNLDINNYRPHSSLTSTVYYRRVKTATSGAAAAF